MEGRAVSRDTEARCTGVHRGAAGASSSMLVAPGVSGQGDRGSFD